MSQLFLEWEMFQTNVSGKTKTVYVKWFFPRKSCWLLWDNIENVVERDRQGTDGELVRFICRISEARTDTLRICNIAYPRQQLLPERTSLLLYKYIALCEFTTGCINLRKSLTTFTRWRCPLRAFFHKSCLQYTNKMHIHNKLHELMIILSSTCFVDYYAIFNEKYFISAHIYKKTSPWRWSNNRRNMQEKGW
jgi:hypothetical protein